MSSDFFYDFIDVDLFCLILVF